MQIQFVDPREYVEPASQILKDAWEPPCLCYAPEYLHWQFDFPGPLKSCAVLAFDGTEPAGFSAAMPRRMRWRDRTVDVYLCSFFSVRPTWRTLAFSLGLLRELATRLREMSQTLICFAAPGSIGEELMVRNLSTFGYQHRDLVFFRTYGFFPRSSSVARPSVAAELTAEECRAAIEQCHGRETLWSDPTIEQLRHYLVDPRGRVLLKAGVASEGSFAATMSVCVPILTAQGPERVAMVDSVFCMQPQPEQLVELLIATSERMVGCCTSRSIMAPSLRTVDPLVLKHAGLRETLSGFQGHLFSLNSEDDLLDATTTNLEIV